MLESCLECRAKRNPVSCNPDICRSEHKDEASLLVQCRGNQGNHGLISWYSQNTILQDITFYNAAGARAAQSPSPLPAHKCSCWQ